VTNIVLDEATGDLLHALSKGLGIMADDHTHGLACVTAGRRPLSRVRATTDASRRETG
jgi:hypothetical protein